jgi:hypothetical protein
MAHSMGKGGGGRGNRKREFLHQRKCTASSLKINLLILYKKILEFDITHERWNMERLAKHALAVTDTDARIEELRESLLSVRSVPDNLVVRW